MAGAYVFPGGAVDAEDREPDVAEVCADYVVEQGGLYLTQTRVRKILVEDGRAVGVRIDGHDIRARAVISNAGTLPQSLRCSP